MTYFLNLPRYRACFSLSSYVQLKIVGTLYDIERPKGMFGKELPTRYNKIGSFVGRRRVVLLEEDDDDDDDDNSEEYSEMEEDDEEGMYDQHVGNEGPEEVVDPEDDPYYGDPYYGESGGDEEEYDDRRM